MCGGDSTPCSLKLTEPSATSIVSSSVVATAGLDGTYSSAGFQQTRASQLEAAMELSLFSASARRATAGTQEWRFR